MKKISLSRASIKFLEKLGSNKFAKQIAIKIKQLAANGHLHDSKSLRGNLSDYYRVDAGEYQIIYILKADEVLISLIGKRNDEEVYKLMNKKI